MVQKQLILPLIITALALLLLALAPKPDVVETNSIQAWPTGIENATPVNLSVLLSQPQAAPTVTARAMTP